MAFTQRPNTANAFTPREPGDYEFEGDGDIDGQPYRVKIKRPYKGRSQSGRHYASRQVVFVDKNTQRAWEIKGLVFDKRIDPDTGDTRPAINDRAPAWTGDISGDMGLPDPVKKDISIWERLDKNQNVYFSCAIRDPRPRPVTTDNAAAPQSDYADNPFG
ncbi:hypothetical protein GCM10019059_36780 [Camelimonas fluminis]|uniref:DUF669 domain-containing protein n=1 Tax=Camelimonas fluminis TaxID=1576911 RepID=A0ABV7UII5_9HYPH|nr:hypothetical protein [Camelimonas fluminis]GHE73880.1 hypothetical protein GCM10019059_36780 [Camelimonas fluminis]